MPLYTRTSKAAEPSISRSPVDWVDPNIGGVARLLRATTPVVQLPHGLATITPVTPRHINDRYLADTLEGFHLGSTTLMPIAGPLPADPAKAASDYDHDLETATPCCYRVLLETYDITVTCTVARRAGFFRFEYPQGGAAHLVCHGKRGEVTVTSTTQFQGVSAARHGARSFFYAESSMPFTVANTGTADALVLTFDRGAGQTVDVRVGLSYISIEQARRNLQADLPDGDFDAAIAHARSAWEQTLGHITVEGGTESQRRLFYTSLYRAHCRMHDITEGGRYRGFDGDVHEAGDHRYHADDWLWDTYRCMHPLQLLLDPHRQEEMIQSYVRMYEQTGWMPRQIGLFHESGGMLGYHATAFIVDTYFKGLRHFDVDTAYAAMLKNAMQGTKLPRATGPFGPLDRIWESKGFFPALDNGEAETDDRVHPFEGRQPVSVTLETAYDDWCLAQLAKALGKNDDYELLMARAANYRNVFDSRIGFMAPRTADGAWVEDYDPLAGGGQGGRAYFAECNGWIYTWHVQHDVAGLIELMGGREKFIDKLDALFVEQYGSIGKYRFLAQFPDCTALIGQYTAGNEPAFHIPYLYCYAGQPWKTQRRIRQIMELCFHDTPEGIPGDEDGGAMSSWYAFNAMGFYPVCPGAPYYVIGSPVFERSTITDTDGHTFTITAPNVSAANKYIQSAELNGRPLDRPWFTHADIATGGSLILHMGPRPNKQWGSAPIAAPPSMSDPK